MCVFDVVCVVRDKANALHIPFWLQAETCIPLGKQKNIDFEEEKKVMNQVEHGLFVDSGLH